MVAAVVGMEEDGGRFVEVLEVEENEVLGWWKRNKVVTV